MSTMAMVETANTRRRKGGGWMVLARLGWIAVFCFSLYMVFATIPESYVRETTICVPPNCADDQMTSAGAANLAEMGISLSFVAWYNIALSVIFALVYAGLAALIFWRRPDDP